MIKKILPAILLILILFAIPLSLAHTDEAEASHQEFENEEIKAEKLKSDSFKYILIASAISILTIIISFSTKHKSPNAKTILFLTIIIPVLISTLYLLWSTIYINSISETGGPVHYHADFEIWNCNQLIDLFDPKGLLNRVGTPVFHEHNDNRIHVEGAVIKKSNIDLHSFFETVGGSLTSNQLTIPTNSDIIELNSPGLCSNSSAFLQVFLYEVINPSNSKKTGFKYRQTKLTNFEDYILSPYQNIPPGDCIIIEFSPEKQKTNKICESYKVAIQNGDLTEE